VRHLCIPHRWRAAALAAAAFCLVGPRAAHAHDPGLSFLDVRVTALRIEATLSLSAADAKVAIGHTGGSLDAFASQSLVVRSDGIALRGRIEARSMDQDAAIVRVSFDGAAGSRLAIASDVPRRLAVGHRELVTVRGANGTLLAERMTDVHDSETTIDLAGQRKPQRTQNTQRQFLSAFSAFSAVAFLTFGFIAYLKTRATRHDRALPQRRVVRFR
jgi:hypothetical protein